MDGLTVWQQDHAEEFANSTPTANPAVSLDVASLWGLDNALDPLVFDDYTVSQTAYGSFRSTSSFSQTRILRGPTGSVQTRAEAAAPLSRVGCEPIGSTLRVAIPKSLRG
jgi:hypothetical protein